MEIVLCVTVEGDAEAAGPGTGAAVVGSAALAEAVETEMVGLAAVAAEAEDDRAARTDSSAEAASEDFEAQPACCRPSCYLAQEEVQEVQVEVDSANEHPTVDQEDRHRERLADRPVGERLVEAERCLDWVDQSLAGP